MNEYALYHKPDTQYSYAKSENVISVRFRTAKEDSLTVYVIYGGKYTYAQKRFKKELSLRYTDRLYNYYAADLQLEDKRLKRQKRIIFRRTDCPKNMILR